MLKHKERKVKLWPLYHLYTHTHTLTTEERCADRAPEPGEGGGRGSKPSV